MTKVVLEVQEVEGVELLPQLLPLDGHVLWREQPENVVTAYATKPSK